MGKIVIKISLSLVEDDITELWERKGFETFQPLTTLARFLSIYDKDIKAKPSD
jgi:hypothetical protein